MIVPTKAGKSIAMGVRRNRPAAIAALILVALAVACFAAPLISHLFGIDGGTVNLLARLEAPSFQHPLGTDELGRDLLIRLLEGGRVSLLTGAAGSCAAAFIGIILGIVSGYAGGRTDAALMRVTDGVIALPLLPLLIVLAAVDMTKVGLPEQFTTSESASLYRIILIIALFGWTTVARLVRAGALAVREREFVLAARALGSGPLRIMFRHVLPNVISPVIVATTLTAGNVILLESVLSFLGLGVQPPLASWGNMLSNAQELMWSAPALAMYPGTLIFLTVLAFNFLGDGLQQALDPRRRRIL